MPLSVDRPAVDRAGGVEDGLGDRRVGVDDSGQLLVAALERHHGDELGDHVAGAVPDYVGAEDLAVLGAGDELDEPIAVVVDGGGPAPAELLAADLDVVAGLLRLSLGEADARHLGVAEGRARDLLDVNRVGRVSGDRLDGDDALLLRLVGERRSAYQVAYREHLLARGPLDLIDLDLAPIAGRHAGGVEVERIGVGPAAAGDAEVVDLGGPVAVAELDRLLADLDVLDRGP